MPSDTLDFKKLTASPWAFTKDLGSWGTTTYMTWVPMYTMCHSCMITYLISLHLWENSMGELLCPFDREKKPRDQIVPCPRSLSQWGQSGHYMDGNCCSPSHKRAPNTRLGTCIYFSSCNSQNNSARLILMPRHGQWYKIKQVCGNAEIHLQVYKVPEVRVPS